MLNQALVIPYSMIDTITTEKRSRIMSRIRSKNTAPEMVVRKLIFSMGYRYRLHRRQLPGCPDIVFPGKKKVIFVHGCFWHCHAGCKRATVPQSNRDYWYPKLKRNSRRDKINQVALVAAGWNVMIIWECEIKNSNLAEKIRSFLSQN
ncbi:very short patch repair endonuclease [Methylobacter sp. sgz302048]|uniref:very short patch repair endonuclease n=1 Tax=Methylobacter sp. sgz302048 TaxID=3455945 RepID=UPI003FA11A0C